MDYLKGHVTCRTRAWLACCVLCLVVLSPSIGLARSNYPFSFKGVVNISGSYQFSIHDGTSNQAAWLGPGEDVNGFSVIAFDPHEKALTFNWNGSRGILYLGGGSAGGQEVSRHESSSQTRVVFRDFVPDEHTPEVRLAQSTLRNTVSRDDGRLVAGTSPSSDNVPPLSSYSVTVGPPQHTPPAVQPEENEVGKQRPLSEVELRNSIGVNRINSRPHASDHIRDREEEANI